jgi:hypothetical protein
VKNYSLKKDSAISNKNGQFTITKGTEISSDGYIDEDGGIKGTIDNGNLKGTEIVFNISELDSVIIMKLFDKGVPVSEIAEKLSGEDCIYAHGMDIPPTCSEDSDCQDCWIKCLEKKLAE